MKIWIDTNDDGSMVIGTYQKTGVKSFDVFFSKEDLLKVNGKESKPKEYALINVLGEVCYRVQGQDGGR